MPSLLIMCCCRQNSTQIETTHWFPERAGKGKERKRGEEGKGGRKGGGEVGWRIPCFFEFYRKNLSRLSRDLRLSLHCPKRRTGNEKKERGKKKSTRKEKGEKEKEGELQQHKLIMIREIIAAAGDPPAGSGEGGVNGEKEGGKGPKGKEGRGRKGEKRDLAGKPDLFFSRLSPHNLLIRKHHFAKKGKKGKGGREEKSLEKGKEGGKGGEKQGLVSDLV